MKNCSEIAGGKLVIENHLFIHAPFFDENPNSRSWKQKNSRTHTHRKGINWNVDHQHHVRNPIDSKYPSSAVINHEFNAFEFKIRVCSTSQSCVIDNSTTRLIAQHFREDFLARFFRCTPNDRFRWGCNAMCEKRTRNRNLGLLFRPIMGVITVRLCVKFFPID